MSRGVYDISGNQLVVSGGASNENIYNNFPIALTADKHDIPQNRGADLSYKRALQLRNLPWTALSAIPTTSSQTGCAAGNHTGVIYSSVKEYDKYVGYNVSFRTFMTAVHNPYSLLYTEDTLKTRSRSAYGITYNGINCGAYFGAVCNTFALYSIGMPIDYNTAEFAYLAKKGVFEKIVDQTAGGVRLGDIIWEPGHGNGIVDIVRDDRGVPTTIYWAEEIHNFPIIHPYTLAQAQSRMTQNGAIIYRYTDLYKSLNYEASPFVAVEGETAQTYEYNDDICTYAGDYAAFYEGEAVHINYVKGSYTSMELYKGDTVIQTITLPVSYNETHSVDVSSYLSGYGKYKARLTDGTNNSDYTYFEVVETNVSVSKNGNVLTVNFNSANGTPQYVQLTYRNGKSRGIYALNEDEIQAGKCSFDALELAKSQSYDDGFTETTYVKVFFIADYGIVRNDFLNTGLR